MTILTNPRHEAFAQAIARGVKIATAYTEVYGPHVKHPNDNAAHLLRRFPQVSARVAELQAKSAEGAVMSLREKLEFLTKAVLTPANQINGSSPLCQRIKPNGEIHMVDKLRALELLARLKGEFTTTREPEVEYTITAADIADAARNSPVLARLSEPPSPPPAFPPNGE